MRIMQNSLQERGIGLRAVFVALAVALAMTFACALVAPATAFALDTEKCSARPNAESGNDIWAEPKPASRGKAGRLPTNR